MPPRPTFNWFTLFLLVCLGAELHGAAPIRTDRLGDPLPPGAVARLGAVRLWHGAGFNSLAFAPDGKSLAAQSGNGDFTLWSVADGRLRYRLPTTGTVLNAIAFAPRGTTLAVGAAGGKVRLMEALTGRETRLLGLKDYSARCVAFSPDGRVTAVGMKHPRDGGGIALYDRTRAKPFRWSKTPGGVFCLAFSPDGKRLASGGFRAGLRLWDVGTGEEMLHIDAAGLAVRSIAFSRDGKTLLTIGPPSFRWWDVAGGKELHEDRAWRGGLCAAYAPDGKRLAWGGSDGVLHLVDAATGKEVRRFTGHQRSVIALAFSADGKTLASGSVDQTIRLWDVATGADACPLPGRRHTATCLAYHPGGKLLAVGGWGGVTLWDVPRSREVRHFPLTVNGRAQRVAAVAFSPDGTRLAAGGTGGTIVVWDRATGKERHRLTGPPRHVGRLGFTPDGNTLLTAAPDHPSLWVWHLSAGKAPRELRPVKGHGSPPALSPDGDTVAVEGDTVRLWDRRTGKERAALRGRAGRVNHLQFSPDGMRLVSDCRADRTFRVWDVAAGRELSRWTDDGVGEPSVAFSPDGMTVAFCAFPGAIRLLEVVSGQQLAVFVGHHVPVNEVAFSPDGRTLASAGADSTVLVWDVTGLLQDVRRPARPLTADELSALWDDLASDQAPTAHRALWRLAAVPRQAVPLLKQHLQPAPLLTPARLDALIRDLDDAKYRVRHRATKELELFQDRAEAALRKALQSKPTLEVRRRIEDILRTYAGPYPPISLDHLRELRAVRVLGLAGTPAARRLLRELAKGDPEAPLTWEAKTCLRRLALPPAAPGRPTSPKR